MDDIEIDRRQKGYIRIKFKVFGGIKSNHPQRTIFSNNETTL